MAGEKQSGSGHRVLRSVTLKPKHFLALKIGPQEEAGEHNGLAARPAGDGDDDCGGDPRDDDGDDDNGADRGPQISFF